VPAGPQKFTGYLPVFKEQQPLGRPRNDRGRDRHLRVPVHLVRIPEAERRPKRGAVVPVDVREVVAVQHHLADQRIDNVDGDVVIGEVPAVEESASEVHDPDRVGLGRRPDWTFPDADPVGGSRQPEVGKEAPDRGVLIIYA
jgi:hypothetical protein